MEHLVVGARIREGHVPELDRDRIRRAGIPTGAVRGGERPLTDRARLHPYERHPVRDVQQMLVDPGHSQERREHEPVHLRRRGYEARELADPAPARGNDGGEDDHGHVGHGRNESEGARLRQVVADKGAVLVQEPFPQPRVTFLEHAGQTEDPDFLAHGVRGQQRAEIGGEP